MLQHLSVLLIYSNPVTTAYSCVASGSDLGVVQEQSCITMRLAGNSMLQENDLELPKLCLAMYTDGSCQVLTVVASYAIQYVAIM